MSAFDQVLTLRRQFPRATELAVSRDLLNALLDELSFQQRWANMAMTPAEGRREVLPRRGGGWLAVTWCGFCFQDCRVVVTGPA